MWLAALRKISAGGCKLEFYKDSRYGRNKLKSYCAYGL